MFLLRGRFRMSKVGSIYQDKGLINLVFLEGMGISLLFMKLKRVLIIFGARLGRLPNE